MEEADTQLLEDDYSTQEIPEGFEWLNDEDAMLGGTLASDSAAPCIFDMKPEEPEAISFDFTFAPDSNLITTSDYYKTGVSLPDRLLPMKARTYSVANDDILVGGVAVMFFIMASIVFRSRMTIVYRIKEFFTSKRKYSDELMNENSSEATIGFILTAISAMSLSLVYFDHLADKFQFNSVLGVPYWVFAVGIVAFMLFVYAKAWFYSIVNWVFFDKESRKAWMLGYLFLTGLTSFLFFPISLVVIFYEDSFGIATQIAILVGVLYEVMLLFKLFANFKTKKYGSVLLFLYFCSVELIPALVLWNVLSWLTNSIIVKNLIY